MIKHQNTKLPTCLSSGLAKAGLEFKGLQIWNLFGFCFLRFVFSSLSGLVYLFLATIVLGSCGRGSVYDRSIEISEKGWHEDSVVVFDDVIISDTISLHNFYINLRHSTDYRFSNFYLFLSTTLPNGRVTQDTIELVLADNYGKWYGNGSGHFRENKILVRKGLLFPLKGNYQFTIKQAMREDDKMLEGIRNVGVRVE